MKFFLALVMKLKGRALKSMASLNHLESIPNTDDRRVLFQTEEFEIISINWTNQKFSAFHDHGQSQCLVLIEEGVFENHLARGNQIETRIFEKGQVVYTPIGARHELHCKTPTGKTLHVYTPRLKD